MKPDGRYRGTVVEVDRVTQSDADVAKAFHGQSVTIPLAVILALITAAGGVLTGYFSRGGGTPVDCASKESVVALSSSLEQLNTRFTALTEKVIADSERQHNDLVDLKLKVIEQGRAK